MKRSACFVWFDLFNLVYLFMYNFLKSYLFSYSKYKCISFLKKKSTNVFLFNLILNKINLYNKNKLYQIST